MTAAEIMAELRRQAATLIRERRTWNNVMIAPEYLEALAIRDHRMLFDLPGLDRNTGYGLSINPRYFGPLRPGDLRLLPNGCPPYGQGAVRPGGQAT